MVAVTVYTRESCVLCADALAIVERVRDDLGFDCDVVDVDDDPELRERYGERVPCVLVEGDVAFEYRVSEDEFREALAEASE